MQSVIDKPITIDPEFAAAIPPLNDDELAILRSNIISDGCRDPLVTWNGILIDGHNRYRICSQHGISFKTVEKDFDSRESALDWMDNNQLGRRNLKPDQISLLRGRRYNRVKRPQGGTGANQFNEQRDQNDPSAKTAEIIGEQYGVSAPTIKRDGKFADAVEALKPFVPDVEQRIMSGEIPKKDIIDAAQEPEQAEERLSRPHVSNNSGNNEWYTPVHIIEAARVAMGRIDLDPASCKIANETVGAIKYFDIDQNGLEQRWHGNVWLNPPYSGNEIKQFIAAVCEKWIAQEINQTCVLVNNASDTTWFHLLLDKANAICLLKGRVKFDTPNGPGEGTPLQGQAVFYFGRNIKEFAQAFSQLGRTLALSTAWYQT